MKLVIEGGCLLGVGLVTVVTTPLLTDKVTTRDMAIRMALVIGAGLVYVFINPKGGPDPFPVVVAGSIFVGGILGLAAGVALSWRALHRGGNARLTGKVTRDFSSMVIFGIFAAGCLIAAGFCGVATVQALADDFAYRHAPLCPADVSAACRSQVEAVVERTWADSSKRPYWVEVSAGGRSETIEIDTATNVWQQLIPGQTLELTSWKGKVTQVTRPGLGTMQASDSPGFTLLISAVFLGVSLFGLLVFSAFGLVYLASWRLGQEPGPHLMTASGDWA